MTYDPGRDPTNPLDVNPNQRRYQGFRDSGSGMATLLGILAILILGGFFFYSMSGDRTVATNDSRPAATAPSTTGAAAPRETTGATMPAQRPATPAPATPAPAR